MTFPKGDETILQPELGEFGEQMPEDLLAISFLSAETARTSTEHGALQGRGLPAAQG